MPGLSGLADASEMSPGSPFDIAKAVITKAVFLQPGRDAQASVTWAT